MKYVENAKVISQKEISPGIFDLRLQTENIAKEAVPGQFVSVYTNDRSRLLPRPISICEADIGTGVLRLVYRVTGKGTGTEEFSLAGEGATFRVEGPLGNGFSLDVPKNETVMLVGGGIGIPPLLETAKRLDAECRIVLGYRDSSLFLKKEFEQYGDVYIATEDGTAGIRGNVLDVIRQSDIKADRIYSCGPKPMLRALAAYAEEKNIPCFVSMEERMACGIGACLACVCKSREKDAHTNVHNKRICKEGPVFLSTEVEL